MRYRREIIMLVAAAFTTALCLSCGQSQVKARLSDIESFINERPDSALAALRAIDTLDLRTRAEKAKFSLLHAMALDKNYIDTADTRVVMPAVDYYSRHGSPEERLKAFMYMGTELHNAGRYNEAIVAFNQADEFSNEANDYNLLGLLYSKMGITFSQTQEYALAEEIIDKSIFCFNQGGRVDQKNRECLIRMWNLLNLMNWEEADKCYYALSQDSTLSNALKARAEGYYAMSILYNPSKDDTLAISHFKKALEINGALEDNNQYCAYAYVLDLLGETRSTDSFFNNYH